MASLCRASVQSSRLSGFTWYKSCSWKKSQHNWSNLRCRTCLKDVQQILNLHISQPVLQKAHPRLICNLSCKIMKEKKYNHEIKLFSLYFSFILHVLLTRHTETRIHQIRNVFRIHLSPDCTSLIQPGSKLSVAIQDQIQGWIHTQNAQCMEQRLGWEGLPTNIHCEWCTLQCCQGWANVPQGSLINGWHNLKPFTMFRNGDGEIKPEFTAFHLSEEKTLLKIYWQIWKSRFLFLR